MTYDIYLNPLRLEKSPGSLTIPDLGSAHISRAVLCICPVEGPYTVCCTTLEIRGETNLRKPTITSFWIASTCITT